MKLSKVLEQLNSLEKNSFIKIIDGIINNEPKNLKQIEKLLAQAEQPELKGLDNIVISKIFNLVKNEFAEVVTREFVNASSQLDILIDILIRDGNCLMKQDWFARLYEQEVKSINKKVKNLKKALNSSNSELPIERIRDYRIYHACVKTAYWNDEENNRESKITDDELSILLTLSKELVLSQEEVKLINYMILDVPLLAADTVINDLKTVGVIFYSKKNHMVFVPDELVSVLRSIRGKEIADKHFRRVLRLLRDAQINLICRKHQIDWKQEREVKIKEVINEGISVRNVLGNDIHRDDVNLTERKKFLNDFWSKELKLSPALKGVTLDEKIDNIIGYFHSLEQEEKVSISFEGFEKLLIELGETLPKVNAKLKEEFELQDENVLKAELLLDYNIKPRDVIEIMSAEEVKQFCELREIKTRGNEIENILDHYKDAENLFLENYVNIGYRDYNVLKENGITIRESEIGLKFEDLTKAIFTKLGFNVDEELKKQLNTNKDKIDIVLNLGKNDLILVECKTSKERGYNKFSSVSRQLKSYATLVKAKGYKTLKTLLVAPEFSDDFINDTELEYELNLSLLTAESLINILIAFKNTKKHSKFPYKLLMRDVLINEDRIIKAISK